MIVKRDGDGDGDDDDDDVLFLFCSALSANVTLVMATLKT